MYKNVLIIFFLAFYTFLSAQNLNKKKEELKKLQKDIQKQEKIIKEKEKQKQKKVSILKKHKSTTKKLAKKLSTLKYLEKKIKKELLSTQYNLQSVKKNIRTLHNLLDRELLSLMWEDIDLQLAKNDSLHSKVIAELITQTSQTLDQYNDKENKLLSIKKKTKSSYTKVKKKKKLTIKKKRKYDLTIKKLKKDITKLTKEEQKAIKLKEQLEKNAKELNDLISKLQMDLTKIDYDYKFKSKLVWPLKGEIIRKFGLEKNPKYKRITIKNNGIDIKAEIGTKVHAIADGVVAFSNVYAGQGKLIIIDHKNGYYSLYAHNSQLLVSKGESVKAGQVIALSGDSGQVEEASLHFEIRKRGTPVNPLDFLK